MWFGSVAVVLFESAARAAAGRPGRARRYAGRGQDVSLPVKRDPLSRGLISGPESGLGIGTLIWCLRAPCVRGHSAASGDGVGGV